MALESIVTVNVAVAANSPSTRNFGIPLLLTYHTRFPELVRQYDSLDALAVDFKTSASVVETWSQTYKLAAAIFSQPNRPAFIKVGRRATATPVHTVVFTPATPIAGRVYTITVQAPSNVANTEPAVRTASVTATGGDTPTTICAALKVLIDAFLAADGLGTTNLTVTAATDLTIAATATGKHYNYTWTSTFSFLDSTLATGLVTDYLAVKAADSNFYGVMAEVYSQAQNIALGTQIQTEERVFFAQTADTNTTLAAYVAAGVGDVLSQSKTLGHSRSMYFYHPTNNERLDAAVLGHEFPYDPGSRTYKFKNLSGVAVDGLTDSVIANVQSKGGNVYVTSYGVPITAEGTMASGAFADVIIGTDWLRDLIRTNVAGALFNSGKIPLTNAGLEVIGAKVRAALTKGKETGFLDPAFTSVVVVPRIETMTASDLQNRIARTYTFTDRLAGAIHSVVIQGTLTVTA